MEKFLPLASFDPILFSIQHLEALAIEPTQFERHRQQLYFSSGVHFPHIRQWQWTESHDDVIFAVPRKMPELLHMMSDPELSQR